MRVAAEEAGMVEEVTGASEAEAVGSGGILEVVEDASDGEAVSMGEVFMEEDTTAALTMAMVSGRITAIIPIIITATAIRTDTRLALAGTGMEGADMAGMATVGAEATATEGADEARSIAHATIAACGLTAMRAQAFSPSFFRILAVS
jgi:hypothetical protein